MQEKNGAASKLLWWILSILSTVVLLLVGAWGKNVQESVQKVPMIEMRVQSLETAVVELKNNIDKGNTKLDTLLSRTAQRR